MPEAPAVSGLDRDRLLREAPEVAMAAAARWVNDLREVGRPVFLAAPAVWDGMFEAVILTRSSESAQEALRDHGER
ncbi:hypothetical protein [Nonomuraea jabiensis]|uniref:hypothetical protein n=1 Tax=Nonomuraea jabiensis TaxID=882448 RepID=UPI0036A72426